MFNPVLLYVNKNHESVSFDEQQNTLTVDFNFLGEKNGQFYDYIHSLWRSTGDLFGLLMDNTEFGDSVERLVEARWLPPSF